MTFHRFVCNVNSCSDGAFSFLPSAVAINVAPASCAKMTHDERTVSGLANYERVFQRHVHVRQHSYVIPGVELSDAFKVFDPVIYVFVYPALEGPSCSWHHRQVHWYRRRLRRQDGRCLLLVVVVVPSPCSFLRNAVFRKDLSLTRNLLQVFVRVTLARG